MGRVNQTPKPRNIRGRASIVALTAILLSGTLFGQAGRRSHPTSESSTMVNVVAFRTEGTPAPITAKEISFFDNGVEQSVRNFAPDLSAAKIVLLVDNSLSIRADVDKLESAAQEFAYEIYDGDKLLIVGYDSNAEIVSDWTDDAKRIEKQLKAFRKQGDPHLFDAIMAVVGDALQPLTAQKRAIVVISDGLDRGSGTKFQQVLNMLQSLDIVVYCVQAQDRTRGAIRRDVPKPKQVINDLAEGTGGRVFPIDDPSAAAKALCDELRKKRHVLSFFPQRVPPTGTRRLPVVGERWIDARSKTMQPAN